MPACRGRVPLRPGTGVVEAARRTHYQDRPGDYRSFFIYEPKKRQISAAPYPQPWSRSLQELHRIPIQRHCECRLQGFG